MNKPGLVTKPIPVNQHTIDIPRDAILLVDRQTKENTPVIYGKDPPEEVVSISQQAYSEYYSGQQIYMLILLAKNTVRMMFS